MANGRTERARKKASQVLGSLSETLRPTPQDAPSPVPGLESAAAGAAGAAAGGAGASVPQTPLTSLLPGLAPQASSAADRQLETAIRKSFEDLQGVISQARGGNKAASRELSRRLRGLTAVTTGVESPKIQFKGGSLRAIRRLLTTAASKGANATDLGLLATGAAATSAGVADRLSSTRAGQAVLRLRDQRLAQANPELARQAGRAARGGLGGAALTGLRGVLRGAGALTAISAGLAAGSELTKPLQRSALRRSAIQKLKAGESPTPQELAALPPEVLERLEALDEGRRRSQAESFGDILGAAANFDPSILAQVLGGEVGQQFATSQAAGRASVPGNLELAIPQT